MEQMQTENDNDRPRQRCVHTKECSTMSLSNTDSVVSQKLLLQRGRLFAAYLIDRRKKK